MSYSNDEFTFDMCRNEIEAYREKIQNYLRCLKDEGNEAVDDLNKAIDRFNCYARGGTVCY